jgi:multidrug efflux pump
VRLRPIVMTTMCFIHMVPPYFAAGAGAEMRRSVGTAMLWGAFGVTLFGIFLTPVFYSVVRWFSDKRPGHSAAPTGTNLDAEAGQARVAVAK